MSKTRRIRTGMAVASPLKPRLVLTKKSTWKWIPLFVMVIAASHFIVQLSRQGNNVVVVTTLEEIYSNMALSAFASSEEECVTMARKYPEPHTPIAHKKKIDLKGPVYATYKWTKPITKELIDIQRNRVGEKRIPGNTRVLFKIKDSVLYVDASDAMFKTIYPEGLESTTRSSNEERCDRFIEMLLLTIHLYQIPDLDFVVELSDAVHPTNPRHPVFSYCISTGEDSVGFTIPSYGAFGSSIGPIQSVLLKECMKVRHPRDQRTTKAVWRGTTTGRHMFNADDALLNPRVNLAYMCSKRPDLFDVGVVDYVQIDKQDKQLLEKLQKVAPLKPRMKMSELNNFAIALDVDGNTWSDRLPVLLRGDSVVLKQEYARSLDYLAESLKQSEAIEFFKYDLSDLATRTSRLLFEYREEREKHEARIEKMTEFAREYISHEGVIRAMAYALTNYASFQDWKIETQEGYVVVPNTRCCKTNNALPRDLIEEVRAS